MKKSEEQRYLEWGTEWKCCLKLKLRPPVDGLINNTSLAAPANCTILLFVYLLIFLFLFVIYSAKDLQFQPTGRERKTQRDDVECGSCGSYLFIFIYMEGGYFKFHGCGAVLLKQNNKLFCKGPILGIPILLNYILFMRIVLKLFRIDPFRYSITALVK